MDASKFAERLNDLIFEKGLQQNQFSGSNGSYWNFNKPICTRNNSTDIKSLVALADYFKCSTDFLLGDTDANSEKKFLQCPEFSVSLKRILADHNCSGYKLCKEAEIPQASFYDWKNGNTYPSLDNLYKIANYFDCTIDYLLGRESWKRVRGLTCVPLSIFRIRWDNRFLVYPFYYSVIHPCGQKIHGYVYNRKNRKTAQRTQSK